MKVLSKCRLLCLGAAAAASLALASTASADSAVLDVAGGNINNFQSSDRTLGWIFSVNSDVTVDALGVWDDQNDGLLASHMVGIWDSGGTLLGSTTVQSGTASGASGPVIQGGQIRYESVAGISLLAGQTYTIGALYDDDDNFISSATSFTVAPEFNYIDERFNGVGDGFTFPTLTASRFGLLGPAFSFQAEVVPTPGAAAGGLALMGLAAMRRRRTA